MGLFSIFDPLELGLVGQVMGVATTGAFLFVSIMYYFQDNLLYFPSLPPGSRKHFFQPATFQLPSSPELGFEQISLTTEDGVKIQVWLFLQPEATRAESFTFLYFHGNAGNLSHRLAHVKAVYHQYKCNVCLVSYRGYGRSKGVPTEHGLKRDARAALDFVLQHPEINKDKIILFGRSLGGAVAIDLCASDESKVAGLIVENTFTSIGDMVDVLFPVLRWLKWMCKNEWDNAEKVKRIRETPVLFLTGAQDELVPTSMMENLYNLAASHSKLLHSFPAGSHNDTWMSPSYNLRVLAFIQDVLSS